MWLAANPGKGYQIDLEDQGCGARPRWAEHGTCGEVRLQNRGRVDVPLVAMLVFAVPSSWRSDPTISSLLRVVGHLTGLKPPLSSSPAWSSEPAGDAVAVGSSRRPGSVNGLWMTRRSNGPLCCGGACGCSPCGPRRS